MALRDEIGPYFGEYGGRFVPESLIAALDELDAAYSALKVDPAFQQELTRLHATYTCLLYTSPSPRDRQKSRMPSSA